MMEKSRTERALGARVRTVHCISVDPIDVPEYDTVAERVLHNMQRLGHNAFAHSKGVKPASNTRLLHSEFQQSTRCVGDGLLFSHQQRGHASHTSLMYRHSETNNASTACRPVAHIPPVPR